MPLCRLFSSVFAGPLDPEERGEQEGGAWQEVREMWDPILLLPTFFLFLSTFWLAVVYSLP